MALPGLPHRSLHMGLELGARTLKVVWRMRRSGERRQWRIRVTQRSQGLEGLRRDLAQLLRPLRHHRLSATVFLAAPTSFVLRLTVRVSDLKRLEEALRGQLPTVLPIDLERAQYQFRLERHERVGDHLECLLSLAACEREPLQRDLEALWQAGWMVSGVVPTALALVQAARTLEVATQESCVLMEIGERRTTIVLVDADAVVYARDLTLGGDDVTEALMHQVSVGQERLSLSRDEAEALKQRLGIPDPQGEDTGHSGPMPVATYLAMIQPVFEQLAGEVRRTMAFGATMGASAAPQRLVITGVGSTLPHCDRWLSQQLSLSVTRLSCERCLGAAGSDAAVALGLSSFERSPTLELQPHVWRQRRVLARSAGWAWKGMAALALVCWLGGAWWNARAREVAGQLEALEARWEALQPVAALQHELAVYEQLERRLTIERNVPTGWFYQLASGFPEPVRLRELAVGADRRVRMTGEARSWEQTPEAYVSELSLWLQRDRLCQDVKLDSTRRVDSQMNLLYFDLTCRMP